MICCFCVNHTPRGSRTLVCAACSCVIRRSLARMARGVFPRHSDRTHRASMMRLDRNDPAHHWMLNGSWTSSIAGPVIAERQFASARSILEARHDS